MPGANGKLAANTKSLERRMDSGLELAILQQLAIADAEAFAWETAMARSLAGDADAYRALLQEAACWLRRYYGSRLDPALVDEAVRNALLALHTRRHTFCGGRPFLPWLAAIARYAAWRSSAHAHLIPEMRSTWVRALNIH